MPILKPQARAAGVLAGPGWLTLVAVLAVVAVNLAGLWGIQVARQALRGEARSGFEQEVAARASRLERRLSEIRADLAFVGATPSIARLDEASEAGAPFARQAAESALLLFLRGNPEVVRISIRKPDGRPLVHVGRRGGVPVLWVSASPTGEEGAAVDPRRPRLVLRLPQGEAGPLPAGGVTLESEVDGAALLDPGEALAPTRPRHCELRDASGALLGRSPLGQGPEPAEPPSAAGVSAEGWSVPEPLRLACRQEALALAEPVFARYRTTLALNLGVMALALLLGGFAVQQARRRAGLEAHAAEEAHVRELERQLFHAERLSTVGRLAAGIAHELNNPLEGMSNYLVLARDALARGDGEGAGRHLGGVKQGLDRAASVVRQVLAHADPAKAAAVALRPQRRAARDRRVRPLAARVRARPSSCSSSIGAPVVVQGSPVMLGQVAMNLLVNGCEAQAASGEVRVVSRREGDRAVVEFMDRGPGVAEADRRRIFEPFFSTKDSTGLGLAICHTIVRQHGGELTVEPRPGGGSLFRMRLPAREGQA